MSFVKAKVNTTDMKETMQQRVVDVVAEIMDDGEKGPSSVDLAKKIREKFDEDFGGNWICVCGKDFSR